MSIDDLVVLHTDMRMLMFAADRDGSDHLAQAADERAQAVSAELRGRLEDWLGNCPITEFLGAL